MKRLIYVMLATFFVCLSLVVPSYANEFVEPLPDSLKPLPTLSQDYEYVYSVVVYRHQSAAITYFCSNEPFEITSKFSPTYKQMNFTTSSKVAKYHAENYGSGWDQLVYTNHSGTSQFDVVNKIYQSDFDIENWDDGGIFFTPTPAEPELYQMIQAVTTEEMTKTQNNLVGTMKILTLCGVGLIALLMVLPLFGKVFRTFRVK